MAFDLIDTLKNLFNNDFSNKAAAQLGENESSVQKALGGIIPAVLTGFMLTEDAIHAPNESYRLASLELGERSARAIYQRLAGLKR